MGPPHCRLYGKPAVQCLCNSVRICLLWSSANGLPHCRLYGKPAVQQANVTALNMADQALPPPPPKPHSKNKESTSSRANGKLNGEHMHACVS